MIKKLIKLIFLIFLFLFFFGSYDLKSVNAACPQSAIDCISISNCSWGPSLECQTFGSIGCQCLGYDCADVCLSGHPTWGSADSSCCDGGDGDGGQSCYNKKCWDDAGNLNKDSCATDCNENNVPAGSASCACYDADWSCCEGGDGCFVEGTEIKTMIDDRWLMINDEEERVCKLVPPSKPIEELKEGDTVVSFDEKGNLREDKVKSIYRTTRDHYYELKTESGYQTNVTGEHPFLAISNGSKRFVTIENLKVGDTVFVLKDRKLEPQKITKLVRIRGPTEVYNLTVKGDETFFANSFAVHNKGETQGTLIGRVWYDTNRNCAFDEPQANSIQRSTNICGSYYTLDGVTVSWSGPQNGSIDVNSHCGPEPYYAQAVQTGTYTVQVNPPAGWIACPSQTVTVNEGDNHAWFGIYPSNRPPLIAGIVPNPPSVCSLGDESSKSTIITTYQDPDEGDGLLDNGSFENGTTDWHFGPINRVVYTSGAKFGNNYLQVNRPCPTCPSELGPTDYSFYQDVSRTTNVGETYTWSVYVRSPTSAPVSGTLALWNMGGGWNDLVVNTPFTVSSTSWQQIKGTSGSLARGGNALRAQVYLGTDNLNYDFDGARLVGGQDAGLWTDIQAAYFGLAPCGAIGEANCGNFEQNLSHYFGAVYYPSTDSVRVAQNSYGASTCSGGAPSANCPWVTVSSFPVSNEDGTVKLTGVRPTVDGFNNLRIEWDLVFDGLPLATYNLYGMVVDNAGAWQNPSGPQWDDKGDITLQECITDPWFQTKDGDVHAGGNINSGIPETATEKYFCLNGSGGYPGVVSYNGSSADFTPAGSVSAPPAEWLANTSFSKKSYNYFYSLLGSPTYIPSPGEIDVSTLETGVYAYDGGISLPNDVWQVGTKKIVILTTGKFLIQNKIAVDTNNGGSLVVVAKGDIGIKKNLTVTGQSGPGNNRLQAFLITDGTFYSGVDPATFISTPTSSSAESNQILVIDGGVIAGGVNLARDFSALGGSLDYNNSTTPTETFRYDPSLFMNIHPDLWKSAFTWEELAP